MALRLFIKPQSPCWAAPFPWTMGTWGDRMVAVQGDRPCTLPGLQTIRRGRNVPTRSQRNRRNRALEGDQSSLVSEAERLSCRCRSNSAGAHRLLAVWQRRFKKSENAVGTAQPNTTKSAVAHAHKLRRLRHQRVRQKTTPSSRLSPPISPDTSYSRICLCGISNAMQRVYSPDRVKYP